MNRPPMATLGMMLAVLICWTAAGAAEAGTVSLPRAFGDVRLGMPVDGLSRLHAVSTASVSQQGRTRSFTVRSQDPHIARIEYRVHDGRLYEQAIYYKRDRVPRGYAGLRDRLREEYGKPAMEDVSRWDDDPDVLSTCKTVWQDPETEVTLTEVHRMVDGRNRFDLMLTMTDRALAQARAQAEDEWRRLREREVPIPLPERARESGAKSAGVTSAAQRNG